MTKIQIMPLYKDVKPQGFYVYLHKRATDGSVFYVGKGSNDRGWWIYARKKHWTNTAKKNGVIVDVVKDGMTEVCALTLERILILKFKTNGTKLTNLTEGGEGVSGYKFSHEANIKNSRNLGGTNVVCSNGMIFQTMGMAEIWLKENGFPKARRSCVGAAVSGRYGYAYGFTWWREGESAKTYTSRYVKIAKSRSIEVICGNGIIFPSGSAGARWARDNGYPSANQANISAVCNGKQNTAYGQTWSFYNPTPEG